jgi:hypothetical protein
MSEKRVAKGTKEDYFLRNNQLVYENGPDSIQKAHALFGGPQGLLGSAARAVGNAGGYHGHLDSAASTEQEIRVFADFCNQARLSLEPASVEGFIKDSPIHPGLEHRVGILLSRRRVIKEYNTRLFDEDTGEVFFKPAEQLFDYLTDHLLANHFFDDDVHLEGYYEDSEGVHVVISQPFIEGTHWKNWSKLVQKLESQGFEHVSKGSTKAQFWIDAGGAGPILITDMHEDNVIVTPSGMAYPIDVHFGFPSRQARWEALKKLGIL